MQKDTVEVIINEDKLTCTTTNPLPKPTYIKTSFPAIDRVANKKLDERWRQAESERKTYEIDFSKLSNAIEALENAVGGKVSHVSYGYEPGTIHQARIENGKAVIL